MIGMSKPKKKDLHKEAQTTIRPGKVANFMLRRIAKQEDRTNTAVLVRALKLYAEQNGYEWPKDGEPLPEEP